jgi:TetR/AcrR family fatty acid metabolism transcriptional regulator
MRIKEGHKEKDILNSAVEVFAEHGYHKAKIKDIADHANVAVGSVYVYYKNKESILLKIFENIWEPLYRELKKISDNKQLSYDKKFDYLIDVVFDSFIEEPAKALVFVNEQNFLLKKRPKRFTNFYELFMREGEKIFKKGIESGIYNKVNIPIFRRFILGGLRDLLNVWAENPNTEDLNSIRESVKAFCKQGIIKNK